ncbi:hypothetical protein BDP67DRAFT_79043 [Colletotrichum lupini]|nr:hypothetical protein BDP67DRAFT_79043 [Colletotrichum lupini]
MLRPRLSLFSLPRSHLNMHSMLLSDSFTVHESQRNRTPTCLSGIHVRGTGRSPESFSNRPVLFPHPTWGDGRKAWTHENVGSFRSSVQQHEKNFAVEIRGYSRRDFFYQNDFMAVAPPPPPRGETVCPVTQTTIMRLGRVRVREPQSHALRLQHDAKADKQPW